MLSLRNRLVLLLLSAATARAAEPLPVMVQSGPGRFEIAAIDSVLAHTIAGQADEAWRILSGPLGLPSAFAVPVYFRVVPVPADFTAPFVVLVETGGLVSVRLRADAAMTSSIRHALVRGLLLRLAVAQHGAGERLRAPAWLEEACVGWWKTRSEAAQLDALKYAAVRGGPPSLGELLQRERGAAAGKEFSAAAVCLLTFLQTESGREREWPAFLGALLGGEEPAIALGDSYPGRFASASERELWWHSGWHQAVRARTLPALEAADSRAQLGALSRFVFSGPDGETDVVVPLEDVLARAGEPIVAADLSRRAMELSRLVTLLHPFYRNAGLALRDALENRTGKPAARTTASMAFARDWRDALELEAATTAALDGVEAGIAPR
ncbi:MAG: hypothetical protein ABIQ12_14890 [Opitutaceae bacterium]